MRKDLYLYNEATGWVLTSECRNSCEDLDSDTWDPEVARGTLLPLSLMQDDSLVIRVVSEEALSEQEEAEWLDRVEAKLSIPDGRLALCAGSEFLESPEDCGEEYVAFVDIPPGDYRTTVYTYFGSVNAPDTDDFEGETLKQYWRRTRKRARVPEWIKAADEDEEWDADEPTYLIGTIVHLLPLEGEVAPPPLVDGWVPETVSPRKPDLCPHGLLSTDIAGLTDKEPYVQTDLVYRHHIPDLAAGLTPVPVEGGPVEIPLSELVLPYWLSWLAGDTHPYVRLFDCPGVEIEWPNVTEGILGTPTEEGWTVEVEGMNARFTPFRHLKQISQYLSALPEGAGIELATADNQSVDDDEDDEDDEADEDKPDVPYGFHRFVGRVRDGKWRIEATYPPLTAQSLSAMLDFAREADAADGFTLRDKAEAERILDDCKRRDSLLSDHPPIRRGKKMTFKKDQLDFLPFLAARFWVVRFAEVLPSRSRDDEDSVNAWNEGMDNIARAGAAWTVDESVVFASDFAKYTKTDLVAAAITEVDELEALDADFLEQELFLLGDLHCSQTFNAIFRGYAGENSHIYGAIICNGFGSRAVDLFTRFEDGWALTTSLAPFANSFSTDRKQLAYRQGTQGDLNTMWEAHEAKLAELSAKHGGYVPSPPSLEAFAQQLDIAMKKQFGV